VTDFRLYRKPRSDTISIVAFGSRSDSAFAVWLNFSTDPCHELFLETDKNQTGGEQWIPIIRVVGEFDYDHDGNTEILAYLNPVRDATRGRTLFSIELESRRLEWSLPVAAKTTNLYSWSSCNNDSTRGIIFDAHNQFQGNVDSLFSDSFGYLVIVNDSGKVVSNRIGSIEAGGFDLRRSQDQGYYLIHDIELTEPDSVKNISDSVFKTLENDGYYLSKLDCSAEVSNTVSLAKRPNKIWVLDSLFGESEAVFVYYESQEIQAYTPSLELIGESEWGSMRGFLGESRIRDYGRVFIFSRGIYSSDFKMLCAFPFTTSFAQPIQIDSVGNLTRLAIGNENAYILARIGKRAFWDRMANLYYYYRIYIIGVLAGLVTALLVTLAYNRKLNSSRMKIASQKKQLEETQAKIISQEKMKQARDIAGGFAHQIRNALFPARTAVIQLSSSDDKNPDPAMHRQLLSLLEESIVRGIKLTRLIMEYVKIENARNPQTVNLTECVDSTLGSVHLRIIEQGVRVEKKIGEYSVISNRDQLEMCIANVLSNALDALTETENPTIILEASRVGSEVVLTVSDNGPGIDLEDTNRVFDFFYSTKPDTGVGIGLSITKLIVEMYDGLISVKSDPGIRTEFRMKFKHSQDSRKKLDYSV